MKQTILELLKAKFVGVSNDILNRIAEQKAKTVTTEEEAKTVVDGIDFQQVLTMYGDSRATQAQQSAVKNYEDKYHLKDGKAIEQPQPPTPPTPDDVPSWAQAIIDSNKQLKEELAAQKLAQTAAARKTQIDALVKDLPDNIKASFGLIPLDTYTDEQFTELLNKVKTQAEGIAAEIQPKPFGAPFAGGTVITNPKATDAETNAVLSAMGIN